MQQALRCRMLSGREIFSSPCSTEKDLRAPAIGGKGARHIHDGVSARKTAKIVERRT